MIVCVWGHVILPPAPGLDTWEPLRACFAERWTIALQHTDSGLSKPVRVYLSMWYIIYIKIWCQIPQEEKGAAKSRGTQMHTAWNTAVQVRPPPATLKVDISASLISD